jgi:hypothetical protein
MLLITILLSLFSAPLPVHEYHVSKTNVRYVEEKAEVQVEMHLFVEDLEKDMAAAGAPALELGTKRQHEDADRYLASYLDKHFTIRWNGEDLPLEVLGYELEDDLHGIWVYQVAMTDTAPKDVAVTNSLLTGTYADQKNIVKLYNGEARSATLLMSKDRSVAEHSFSK